MSLLTHPWYRVILKNERNIKIGTDEWFKTWRTLAYLTNGRKNIICHHKRRIRKITD